MRTLAAALALFLLSTFSFSADTADGSGAYATGQYRNLFAEAGHSVYCERPDEYNRIITAFIDRIGGAQ